MTTNEAPSRTAKYVGEFVGTFMLVLTVGCNVLTGSPVWGVTSIACVLMVMIYAIGPVSGGHFNPAVSLAAALTTKVDGEGKNLALNDMCIYMACQIIAGILAGFTYSIALDETFNLAPTPGFHWYQAALAEILYTFMLCFVVLNVACSNDKGNQYFGLAIGFVVVAGGYGAGHISGGCFNPAVAIGIDVASASLGFGYSILYTFFELIGACIAVGLYQVVRKENLMAKLVSEFLGTFMLVLTVGLNVLGGSKAPVFSIAAALMCMIYALGSVSGANFNPAVTLCLLITKRPAVLNVGDGIKYIAVQLLGGILAGFTYMLMEGGKTFPLGPGARYHLGQAAFAEIAFTFLLCYVVCCTATVQQDKKLTEYFGLAIGSCVTAGGYAIGTVSGGSLNPAVSFGIAVSHMSSVFNAVMYAIFECLGAVLAAVVFKWVTHAHDETLGQAKAAELSA